MLQCKLEEEENEEDEKENLDLLADSDMNVEVNLKSEIEDTKGVVIKDEKVPVESSSNTDNKNKSAEKTDEEIADEYGLEDYDDEDEKEKENLQSEFINKKIYILLCPRSFVHICIGSRNIKMDKTSWTYSTCYTIQ